MNGNYDPNEAVALLQKKRDELEAEIAKIDQQLANLDENDERRKVLIAEQSQHGQHVRSLNDLIKKVQENNQAAEASRLQFAKQIQRN